MDQTELHHHFHRVVVLVLFISSLMTTNGMLFGFKYHGMMLGRHARTKRLSNPFGAVKKLFTKKTADEMADDYTPEPCRDDAWDCGAKSMFCYMPDHAEHMRDVCKWECGLCDAVYPPYPDCPDVADDCALRMEECLIEDKELKDKMTRECAHTCQRCDDLKSNRHRTPGPNDEDVLPQQTSNSLLDRLKAFGATLFGGSGQTGSNSLAGNAAPAVAGIVNQLTNGNAPGGFLGQLASGLLQQQQQQEEDGGGNAAPGGWAGTLMNLAGNFLPGMIG